MSAGFTLRELRVTGPGRPDAVLELASGLNVVTGPSDTGKTYIFQCLNYVMGGGKAPKPIPEARAYDTVSLKLSDRDSGELYELARNLRGGKIALTRADGSRSELSDRHLAGKADSVSAFLLGLSGISGERIRQKASGKTRPVSFRDYADLALIGEEAIIKEGSPVLSGQHQDKTEELQFFRFLLTGQDDSSVIAVEDEKVRQARKRAQTDVLRLLIDRGRAEFNRVPPPATIEEADAQAESARLEAGEALAALTARREVASEVENRRRAIWKDLRAAESTADVLRELETRFVLLDEQYESDLRRLDAIADASRRLDQMSEERCPVCGALKEHHSVEHAEAPPPPADVIAACAAEKAKIGSLVIDLRSTQAANRGELEARTETATALRRQLAEVDEELRERLKPVVVEAVAAFQRAEAARRSSERAADLLRRERELEQLIESAGAMAGPEPASFGKAGPRAGEAEGFAQAAEGILRSWEFPDVGRVTFSEDAQDLVIGGRERSSYGKGIRAVTHGAFSLALLRYCLDEGRPFPGLVVLDSPLVVYREPDPGEDEFPVSVKEHFYESTLRIFEDAQVLILENDEPPHDVSSTANIVRFTKTGSGRYGFIPTSR